MIGAARCSVIAQKNYYRDLVLSDNPVGYWRFSETSGTTAVSEVNTVDMTIPSTNYDLDVTGIPEGGSGLRQTANTVHAHIAATAASSVLSPPASTGISWELWFNIEALPASWEGFIVAFQSTTDNSNSYAILTTGGIVNVKHWNGSSNVTLFTSSAITLDVWYHLVVVREASQWAIYLNGTKSTSGSTRSYLTNNYGFRLMNHSALQRPVKGYVDEGAVYHTALSESEVQAHYDAGI